ncbi:MAG: CHAT domain-containing protein, partial [Terriglobia bacterium]
MRGAKSKGIIPAIPEPAPATKRATAALVKQFYGHLAKKQDKGPALRRAKIDLLKKYGDEALPYYWAGFTLQG